MPKRTPEYLAAQRERILEAALERFADKGLYRTSIDDIARAAGCGKSAIYAHFDSKRAMIEALTERESDLFEMRDLRDMAQLEQYVAESLANLQTPRMRRFSRLTLHMAAESLSDPELMDWEERSFRRFISWVGPLIRSDPAAVGLSERQLEDAARRLIFFWAGQALYKVLMPKFPVALLQADMAAIAPAIIASARRSGIGRARRKPSGKRPSVASQRTSGPARRAARRGAR